MLKTSLLPHQVDAVNFFENRSGVLDAAMGSGKTRMAIEIFLNRLSRSEDPNARVLFIAPLAVLEHLEREIFKHTIYGRKDVMIYHGKNRLQNLEQTRATFIIAGYSSIRSDYVAKATDKSYDSVLSFGILSMHFIMTIFDEAHVLRNDDTQLFKACNSLDSDGYICMSGTPLVNSISDIISTADIAKCYTSLYPSIDDWKLDHYRYIPRSVISLPELKQELIEVNFTGQQLEFYCALKNIISNELSAHLNSKAIERLRCVIAMITRLRQASIHHQTLSKIPKNQDIQNSGKTKYIFDLINDKIDQNEKTVVFSGSVASLLILKELINDYQPGTSLLYTGSISAGERSRIIDEFRENPNFKVLLMSITSGGIGIELTAANNVIIMDPWWNSAIEDQAIARCYRYGQTKTVNVYRVTTKNSIEDWLSAIKQYKNDDISRFYGKDISEKNDMNVLGILRRHLADNSELDSIRKKMRLASFIVKTDIKNCDICFSPKSDFVRLKCKHEYCKECFIKWDESQSNKNTQTTCPTCRQPYYF